MKPTLHSQATAVDVAALQAQRRGSLPMKPREWDMLAPRLRAAVLTLTLLQSWRSRLQASLPEFMAEIEEDDTRAGLDAVADYAIKQLGEQWRPIGAVAYVLKESEKQ